MSVADDPTGFRPVVKEFENIEPVWGRRVMSVADDPTGFRPVVKEFENIEPVGAAVEAAL